MTTLMMLFVFCCGGRSEHYWKSDWHKDTNLPRQFVFVFVVFWQFVFVFVILWHFVFVFVILWQFVFVFVIFWQFVFVIFCHRGRFVQYRTFDWDGTQRFIFVFIFVFLFVLVFVFYNGGRFVHYWKSDWLTKLKNGTDQHKLWQKYSSDVDHIEIGMENILDTYTSKKIL